MLINSMSANIIAWNKMIVSKFIHMLFKDQDTKAREVCRSFRVVLHPNSMLLEPKLELITPSLALLN